MVGCLKGNELAVKTLAWCELVSWEDSGLVETGEEDPGLEDCSGQTGQKGSD